MTKEEKLSIIQDVKESFIYEDIPDDPGTAYFDRGEFLRQLDDSDEISNSLHSFVSDLVRSKWKSFQDFFLREIGDVTDYNRDRMLSQYGDEIANYLHECLDIYLGKYIKFGNFKREDQS